MITLTPDALYDLETTSGPLPRRRFLRVEDRGEHAGKAHLCHYDEAPTAANNWLPPVVREYVDPESITAATALWDRDRDPCGCATEAVHDDGQRMQAILRKQYRIAKSRCVGCRLGDDGPSMHDMGYGCAYGKGGEL